MTRVLDETARLAIGRRLREARERKGLSQRRLSETADMTFANISLLELGKISPGPVVLIELRRALGVSVDWILTGEGAPHV